MYELWDGVSGNLLQVYATEAAALAAVRAYLDAYGRPAAEGLGVLREDRCGRSKLIAEDAALVDRALHSGHRPPAVRAS